MTESSNPHTISRRSLLRMLGLVAVAGTALGAGTKSSDIFAKQFAGEAPHIKLPEMVYDPGVQMMVNPKTRQPIYSDAQKLALSEQLPTVTSSCPDCPKCDDNCQ